MEIIVVPPEFVILFSIPIIGFVYIASKTLEFWPPFLFYIISQVGLAFLTRYIYG